MVWIKLPLLPNLVKWLAATVTTLCLWLVLKQHGPMRNTMDIIYCYQRWLQPSRTQSSSSISSP
jgi:hypothetical protein